MALPKSRRQSVWNHQINALSSYFFSSSGARSTDGGEMDRSDEPREETSSFYIARLIQESWYCWRDHFRRPTTPNDDHHSDLWFQVWRSQYRRVGVVVWFSLRNVLSFFFSSPTVSFWTREKSTRQTRSDCTLDSCPPCTVASLFSVAQIEGEHWASAFCTAFYGLTYRSSSFGSGASGFYQILGKKVNRASDSSYSRRVCCAPSYMPSRRSRNGSRNALCSRHTHEKKTKREKRLKRLQSHCVINDQAKGKRIQENEKTQLPSMQATGRPHSAFAVRRKHLVVHFPFARTSPINSWNLYFPLISYSSPLTLRHSLYNSRQHLFNRPI